MLKKKLPIGKVKAKSRSTKVAKHPAKAAGKAGAHMKGMMKKDMKH